MADSGIPAHDQGLVAQVVRQANLHRYRQMVGDRLVEHVDPLESEIGTEQDVVEIALRPPAGKRRLDLRRHQAEVAQGRVFQKIDGMGVHVAHQHLVAVVADQLADIGELAGAGASAESEMHHHYHQRVGAFAKTHEDRAAPRRTGQRMIFQQGRPPAAEQAVAVLGDTPEVAVELLVPVGNALNWARCSTWLT